MFAVVLYYIQGTCNEAPTSQVFQRFAQATPASLFQLSFSSLLDRCSSPDKTPTFTEHVQSRRFKRSADEYNADIEGVEFKGMEYKDLYHEEVPSDEENQGLISHRLEQNDLDLPERVEELEQTVASMAGTLRKLEDAFNRLQSQASI